MPKQTFDQSLILQNEILKNNSFSKSKNFLFVLLRIFKFSRQMESNKQKYYEMKFLHFFDEAQNNFVSAEKRKMMTLSERAGLSRDLKSKTNF